MPDEPRPILLPTPREVTLTGGWAAVDASLGGMVDGMLSGPLPPAENARVHPDLVLVRSALPGESYSIEITAAATAGRPSSIPAITVSGSTEIQLRHGLRTLSQLIRQYGARLPSLRILDWPTFAKRGVMLDVSRDKVPTMGQLKATVDLLASLKFNHLQLYTEHTFAYRGHDEVWRDASPITPEEARELDGYCSARGVELAANQNCFGHLASWLKKPAYQHLAEIEGDNAWFFHQWERRGPFSLCPVEPRAEAFVGELLGQLLPCFTSGLVNIGCDETFDVGWGRSRGEVERRAGVEQGSTGAAEQGSGREAALARARGGVVL